MKKPPIIILLNAHCDTKSKKVLHKLIPILTQEGYNAYCHEVSPNCSSDEIIYRIIFSDDCDKDTLDVLNDIVKKFPFLESKKVNLESQASIDACVKDIMQEVELKLDYQYEIFEGNTQSRILTGYFGAQFKTMMRKGYYVDAVLHRESKEELQNIHSELMFLGIESSIKKLDSTLSLVIMDINTQEVGDKVMSIQNRR
jgi:hypothetical protein